VTDGRERISVQILYAFGLGKGGQTYVVEYKPKTASSSLPGATAPACKVGVKDCASCHMPRVDLPGTHFKFTDHRIRIARQGDPYPY
jgi:hypothetical protein